MAARAETTPAWQRGKVASWLVTTDHKRIGILYISTSARLLRPRGAHVTRVPAAALAGERGRPEPRPLQRADHDPRHGDGVPRRRPAHGRLRELPRATHDRRPGCRLPAVERAFLLALRPRRRRADAELLREGWSGTGGLDGVSTALDAGSGKRTGPVDPLPPHPHGVVARRRDQLHRHDPQHADAGNVVDADAALRLVDPALRVAPHCHPARRSPRASRSCFSIAGSRSGPGTSRRTSSTRPREDHRSSTSTRSGSSATPRCT